MSSRPQSRLEIVARYCAAEDMGDEIVALNVETGIYFSMRDLGIALWRDLAAGHPVEELSSKVKAATGSDGAVLSFVDQILKHGLMAAASPIEIAGKPAIIGALANGNHEIVLEIFEDMKDLILSDPIHDVDQTAGWPKQPSQAG